MIDAPERFTRDFVAGVLRERRRRSRHARFNDWLDRWKWWLIGGVLLLYLIVPACQLLFYGEVR